MQRPVLNDKYALEREIGDGATAKVFSGIAIADGTTVAIKFIKPEFLGRQDAIDSIRSEVFMLKNLQHTGIVKLLEFGDSGRVVQPAGTTAEGLVFLVLEYCEGGALYELVKSMGALGEEAGRFFLLQMIEAIEYMHGKGVVHRDLKLENVLLDSKFNVKIADFGYTAYQNVNQLQAYRGTMSYMAPEIKEQKIYDGRQTDLFSLGVVIFIIVQGTFPFKEAIPTEMYYSLLATGRTQEYFSTLKADHLSDNFKDLISKLFSYDGNVRYTAQEVKAHPWLAGFDKERTRQMLIDSAERRNQTKV